MVFARSRTSFLLSSCLLFSSAASLSAQKENLPHPKDERIGSLLEHLGATRNPMEAAISPDGKTVAWSFHNSEGYELH